jgi:hypothetical protein
MIVIAAVGFVAPWHTLTGAPFMTAVAFEHAVGSRWIVSIILSAALLSLFKVFNGNFIAASRLLFAMGRRGLVDERLASVHPRNQTPSAAVVSVGSPRRCACFSAARFWFRLRGWIGRFRQRMVRGLRCLFVYEAPNRRPPDRIAGRVGWIGDDIDEARAACAGTFFRLGVARACALDYSWHGSWPHRIRAVPPKN